jgi:hypothetical protein
MPLLYPARTLPTGAVRASGGVSGNFAVGALGSDLEAARSHASGPADTYTRGALVAAAVAPGLAPFVAARVGIGERFEGGATYTGRGVRIDVRRSFDWNDVSLSIGVGATGAFYGNPDTATFPSLDLRDTHGYGADVPVLVGWQSAARIYMAWFGVRGGWDHTDVSPLTTEPFEVPGAPPMLSADRFYGGAVVGMAAGFRHLHAALELDAAYQTVHGSYGPVSATVQGISLAPAAALWWSF